MGRMIDADRLTERLELTGILLGLERSIIETEPTVDAAPVVWKEIPGFEGLYEVSNTGKVRNRKHEILKQQIKRTPCTCYKTVDLWKNGSYCKKYVHRLIAESFIPNPSGFEFVNHKDEDGTNNSIENLEWCTREYNVNYGTARKRQAKKLKGRKSEKRIAVIQMDKDGNEIKIHPSVTSAAESVGCSISEISSVCKGKRKTTRGFDWKYYYPNRSAKMDLEETP